MTWPICINFIIGYLKVHTKLMLARFRVECLCWIWGIWYVYLSNCSTTWNIIFLHAKPWLPGGEKSVFTAVVQYWRSPLHQIARARTIDEYDVTIPLSHIHVTSHVNCDDITILSPNRLSLVTMVKSMIDNCLNEIVWSGHQIACKK